MTLSTVLSPLFIPTLILLSLPTLFYLLAYLIPQIYMSCLRRTPDLKTRYSSPTSDQPIWALVTGAGSGIGKALCFKLASQNIPIILVSLDDTHLQTTTAQLQKAYPHLSFRPVGCTFAPNTPYMDKIIQACKDVDVRMVFNNAGFIVTGFLDQAPLPKLLANMECNATATVQISHYFLQRWVKHHQKACLVFTSSVAGFIPTPFAAMYASTKAFISQLAACLHIECKNLGIDVCAVHPSPVASRFYEKVEHRIELMEKAQEGAVGPEVVVEEIFRSVGACALRDVGGMAWGTRMGTFFIPYNIFTALFAAAAPFLPDYKKHNKTRR